MNKQLVFSMVMCSVMSAWEDNRAATQHRELVAALAEMGRSNSEDQRQILATQVKTIMDAHDVRSGDLWSIIARVESSMRLHATRVMCVDIWQNRFTAQGVESNEARQAALAACEKMPHYIAAIVRQQLHDARQGIQYFEALMNVQNHVVGQARPVQAPRRYWPWGNV